MIKMIFHSDNQQLIQIIVGMVTYNVEIQLYKSDIISNEIIDEADLLIFHFAAFDDKTLSAYENFLEIKIPVLVIFDKIDQDIMRMILHYQIQDYLIMPFDTNMLYWIVLHKISKKMVHKSKDELIHELLEEYQFKRNLHGYSYLKSAVLYCIEKNPQVCRMNDVYLYVARIHMTTVSRVERSIRTLMRGRECTNAEIIYELQSELLKRMRKGE